MPHDQHEVPPGKDGHRKCDNNVGEERREHGLDCEKYSNDDDDEDNDDDDSESSGPKAPVSQMAQFFHFLPPFFPFEAMFVAKNFTALSFSIFSLHVDLLTRRPPLTQRVETGWQSACVHACGCSYALYPLS